MQPAGQRIIHRFSRWWSPLSCPFFAFTLVTLSHIPRRSTRLLVNLIRTQHTHHHHVCRKHIQRLCAQEEKRCYCLWVSHCILWRSLAFHPQLPKTESVSFHVCFLVVFMEDDWRDLLTRGELFSPATNLPRGPGCEVLQPRHVPPNVLQTPT